MIFNYGIILKCIIEKYVYSVIIIEIILTPHISYNELLFLTADKVKDGID